MNKIIIRLPGGGRIKEKKQNQDISWWGYRNFHIDPGFYSEISLIINSNPDCVFYVISGGVGAFMYTNLSNAINLDSKLSSEVGCEIVSILHKILIGSLIERDVKVCPVEVKLNDLDNPYYSNHSCYFIKPDSLILSTDSLAASVASIIEADLILFIKEGAPIYHVGFDTPTKVTEWCIDSIRLKSAEVTGNYLLDSEALDILEDVKPQALIIPPELLSDFSYNKQHYGFGSKDNYTELKYDLF